MRTGSPILTEWKLSPFCLRNGVLLSKPGRQGTIISRSQKSKNKKNASRPFPTSAAAVWYYFWTCASHENVVPTMLFRCAPPPPAQVSSKLQLTRANNRWLRTDSMSDFIIIEKNTKITGSVFLEHHGLSCFVWV